MMHVKCLDSKYSWVVKKKNHLSGHYTDLSSMDPSQYIGLGTYCGSQTAPCVLLIIIRVRQREQCREY